MWLVISAALSLWRSGRRLLSTVGTVSDRAARASDQLSTLTSGVSTEPERAPGRTM